MLFWDWIRTSYGEPTYYIALGIYAVIMTSIAVGCFYMSRKNK